jgi:prephenate dehydrogenase
VGDHRRGTRRAGGGGPSPASGEKLKRISVIGVGLVGGSVGLAAREYTGAHVRGWDPDPRALEVALERGVVDEVAASAADAAAGADAAFVAAPVGSLSSVLDEVLAAAPPECVVTDVGSTKRALVEAHDDSRFVGGHPLAGAETAGVAHARADLFQGATWYLTPTTNTSGMLYERLHRTLADFGAQPAAIDAATHDRLMASVSHLPHVLANVLVSQAAQALADEDERLPAAGPSFRDATRVAGANDAIWTDIYLANREAVIERIDEAVRRLTEVRGALERDDPDAVSAWNARARADRQALLEAELAGGPVHELRVSVPNQPGVIARMALELGRAGINITDMALYPSADMRDGVVALWIAGDDAAARAEGLVGELGFPVARP